MDTVTVQRRMAPIKAASTISKSHSMQPQTHTNGGSTSTDTTKNTPHPSPFRRMLMHRGRRSKSAPPGTIKAKRTLLIEEHYRVDDSKDKIVVLPGVPKHEDDWARDAHDFFNLVALVPLVILNIMNWNWDTILYTDKPTEQAWTGEWFGVFYFYAQSYFVADLMWIILLPHCVRSPQTILQHHIATIIYMLVPLYYPEFQCIMGALLSVEINTWFLIARRVFNKQGFPPWIIDLPPFVSIRIKLISICFYSTWIVIRCIIYPALFVDFVNRYRIVYIASGGKQIINIWFFVIPLHSVFVLLNLKWTHDLIMSKIRYWRRPRGGTGRNRKEEADKGL